MSTETEGKSTWTHRGRCRDERVFGAAVLGRGRDDWLLCRAANQVVARLPQAFLHRSNKPQWQRDTCAADAALLHQLSAAVRAPQWSRSPLALLGLPNRTRRTCVCEFRREP